MRESRGKAEATSGLGRSIGRGQRIYEGDKNETMTMMTIENYGKELGGKKTSLSGTNESALFFQIFFYLNRQEK